MSHSTSQTATPAESWTPAQELYLLDLASRAIETALCGSPDPAPGDAYQTAANTVGDGGDPLEAPRATFVTLRKHGKLRGCIGSLEGSTPLPESVWANARKAAFHDPRFDPLSNEEFEHIEIHISILSPLEKMRVESEIDLLRQLRPGVDGLVLEDHPNRATFLPAVWESLPEPREFVHELQIKAGLRAGHWSRSIQLWRYTAHSIPS